MLACWRKTQQPVRWNGLSQGIEHPLQRLTVVGFCELIIVHEAAKVQQVIDFKYAQTLGKGFKFLLTFPRRNLFPQRNSFQIEISDVGGDCWQST